jgi:hypothetical protein
LLKSRIVKFTEKFEVKARMFRAGIQLSREVMISSVGGRVCCPHKTMLLGDLPVLVSLLQSLQMTSGKTSAIRPHCLSVHGAPRPRQVKQLTRTNLHLLSFGESLKNSAQDWIVCDWWSTRGQAHLSCGTANVALLSGMTGEGEFPHGGVAGFFSLFLSPFAGFAPRLGAITRVTVLIVI